MARRIDHTREELSAMILTAARDVIAGSGLDSLTARALAARIGYSAGTLYNVFESLDDIVLQVNAATLDALGDACRAAASERREGPTSAMIAVSDAYLGFVEGNSNLWRAIFEHRMADGRSPPAWYLERIERLFAILEGILEPLIPGDPGPARHRAARVLWSGVHGVHALGVSSKLGIVSAATVSDMTHDLIRTFLAGLAAKGTH